MKEISDSSCSGSPLADSPARSGPERAEERLRKIGVQQGAAQRLARIGSRRSWGVFCAAFLVMAGTGIIINVLSRRADEDRRVQRSLVQLQGDAHELETLEWKTIFRGKLDGELSERLEKLRSAMDAGIGELRPLEPGLPEVRDVAVKYEACSKLIDEEFRLLADGKIKEAVEFDAAKADPAFDELYQTLSETGNAFDKHASRTLALVRAGTFLVLLAALGFVATLFWHYHQRRRAAEVSAAEQRVLNLLRAIMEGTTDAIFAKDLKGRYLLMNTAGARLVEKTPEEVIGLDDTQLFSEETRNRIIERDRSIIRTGETLANEDISTTLAGRSRVYLTTKGALRDSAGAIIGVFGVSRDITQRKQAEEALAAQVLRYKTLMETSKDSIYVVNEKGDLQEANAAFLRRRGYTAAEVKGLNIADWDARWTREQLQERLRTLAGSSAVFETRHRSKEGSIFDVEVCATSVRIGGKSLFFVVTRDISERKQAEAALRDSETRFRQIAENIDEVFWITDLQGSRTIYISPAYQRIWGRSCESLYAAPKSWRDDIHPEDRPRMEATFASDPGSTGDYTYRIVRPDGSIRWIRDRGFPVRDESGEVVRFAGIAEDITASKCAEEELQQVNEQLRVLSRRLFQVRDDERRHLARELHDEIGQALTAVKINLDSIETVEGSAQSLRLRETSTILDNLLWQVRQISLDLHSSLIDDLGLAPALRSLLDQQARRAGLRTQFCAAEPLQDLDPGIQTTGFRIAQEAITNVLRHAKAQSLSVHLRTEGGKLRMKIVDDGMGFSLAQVERRARHEVGFGLMGMRERAALVGGRVQVISSTNKGTRVEVSLPLNAVDETPQFLGPADSAA